MGWCLVVSWVGRWVWGVGKGDLVAIRVFGHFVWVDYAVWIWWLRELVELIRALVRVRSARSAGIAMRKDAGFLVRV